MLICDWCKEKVPAVYTSVNLSTIDDCGEKIEYDEHADLCDACRRTLRRDIKAAWMELVPKVKRTR